MIALALALLGSETTPFKYGRPIDIYGAGSYSCARAFRAEYEGTTFSWVMGFWSGVGAANGTRSPILIDGEGIVGAVKKLCAENPSMTLDEATTKTYLRFSQH